MTFDDAARTPVVTWGYQPMRTAQCYQGFLFFDRTSHGLVAHVTGTRVL